MVFPLVGVYSVHFHFLLFLEAVSGRLVLPSLGISTRNTHGVTGGFVYVPRLFPSARRTGREQERLYNTGNVNIFLNLLKVLFVYIVPLNPLFSRHPKTGHLGHRFVPLSRPARIFLYHGNTRQEILRQFIVSFTRAYSLLVPCFHSYILSWNF